MYKNYISDFSDLKTNRIMSLCNLFIEQPLYHLSVTITDVWKQLYYYTTYCGWCEFRK